MEPYTTFVFQARVRAMEEESEKLRQLQSEVAFHDQLFDTIVAQIMERSLKGKGHPKPQVDKQLSVPTSPNASLNMSFEEKMDVDNRSVYIG